MKPSAEVVRPSREEIETLCIVYALRAGSCTITDLAARLGFTPSVASAMAEAIEPLRMIGRIEVRDESVSLTEVGAEWLQRRLSELGVQ